MLENLLSGKNSHLTCIDTFELSEEMRKICQRMGVSESTDFKTTFDHNIHASEVGGKVTKIKGLSSEELRKLPLDSFDIVYIDGSQKTCTILTDATLSWGLLKMHGFMILNNYRSRIFENDPSMSPEKAIDAFMQCFDGEYIVVHMDEQVILRKTKDIRVVMRSLSGRDT
jgi:hypothetical protein